MTEEITTGYADGTYRPAENVTRGQMAAFIIRALFGDTFSYTPIAYFTDVPATIGRSSMCRRCMMKG